ncbi:NUDIX domain-containing protein [Streptomyces sp. NPDC054863]
MSSELAHPVIDTHVIVRNGDKILLSQRGGPYGRGRRHTPSGKHDKGRNPQGRRSPRAVRETKLEVDPDHLRLVQVVHHRQNDTMTRIGSFFEATEWKGDPVNQEPSMCMALEWYTVHELPDDIIEYPEAGLRGYLDNAGHLSEHNWG